ncbi:MAG: hypothetical protein RLZZ338_1325 [Cyanobacteriota bacterium]|jgi:hypothetical protein
MEEPQVSEILTQIHSGELLMVNNQHRGGIILIKSFYAEFAGPGAAFGGILDQDCQEIIPVADFSIIIPQSSQDRLKAYNIRQQWVRLLHQLTSQESSLARCSMLLTHLEHYFSAEIVAQLPDEILSLLIGVFPHTIRQVR